MKKNTFANIIGHQFALYPGMTLQDLYKLVYQGVMGSGHAISSEESAENWLRDEIVSAVSSGGTEEPFEEISPDGRVLRINLRPYIAAGGDTDSLLTAFIRTGREYRGSNEELVYWWKLLADLQSNFTSEQLICYMDARQAEYFPAVHHSERYRELYRPSYRVALRDICLEEGVISG